MPRDLQAMNAYNKVMADSPEAIVGSFFFRSRCPMAEQASQDGMLLRRPAQPTPMSP